MADFNRPKDSFRFTFGGVNTKDVPDAIAPDKYAVAQNVRSTGANSVRTRPGYVSLFSTGNNAITDIRAYATLGTDSTPRFLARDAAGSVWLDTGSIAANMNGNAGYGASLLPFRPAESPQTWMYIGAEGDYKKFSAPSNNNVTVYKVGIAEPQNQVQAVPQYTAFQEFTSVGGWNNAGNAGSVGAGNRSADVAGVCIADPATGAIPYYSVQVGNNANANYHVGEIVQIGNNSALVEEVLPAIPGNLTISAIHYQSGNTGNCVIVPSQIAVTDGTGQVTPTSTLRRGSLVKIGGNEVSLVLGVIPGPNGLQAFQTSTNNSFSAGAAITGVPAIRTHGNASPGSNITASLYTANLTTGIGTFTQSLVSFNPFNSAFGSLPNGAFPQNDDFVHLSVNISDPTQLIEMLLLFNLNPGNNYTGDMYYYAVRPGDLIDIVNGNTTTLPAILQAAEDEIIGNLPTPGNITAPSQSSSGNNQWSEIMFPISSLTRLGGGGSASLVTCSGVRLQFNVSNNVTVQFNSLWVGGGGQPDVGNNGAPYRYQVKPLSSLTGVRGNPTPVMTYGVLARRQAVVVKTSALNASYDGQIDTWEVYRYGGSITSYRFLGTAPVGSDFIDSYFDDAAAAGPPLVIDDTEAWPSIDVPWSSNNATAAGSFLTVTGNSFPATIASWLPGTIFQVGNNEAYTLRARPVSSGNSYIFEMEECIGSGNTTVFVLEPNVARQTFPYLWGPNEQGFFFGCGDPLRPGVVSWSKPYAPDAVPTGYNLDLCPPSEPLLGGEVIRGISLCASSKRWWQLYFQQGGTPLYAPVEAPVGRRLAAPFGKCTDGNYLYFWSTDCIAATSGGAAIDLTSQDHYSLFPHAGLSGKNVTRGGVTYYAPDYSRAATFRLAVRDQILYATYQDSNGTSRTLIGELHTGGEGGESMKVAWSSDSYANAMTAPYAVEQPKGTLENSPSLFPSLVFGDNNGHVWKFQDGVGDGGNNITGVLGTFEWDGGDLRANELWGDQFVDVLAPAGVNVQPVSYGANASNNTSIAGNANRQQAPVSLGGGILQNVLGLLFSWTDANNQATPTTLYSWQPSFVQKPETIQDRFGDWYDFGQASYVRGLIIHADTNGNNKNISIRNADTNGLLNFSGGPSAGVINHNGEQEKAYYFTPFVAHMVRDEPQDAVAWRKFQFEWIKDAWPELTTLSSPWMNLGNEGAKYLRGAVMPIDTNGSAVSLTFLSSDGGNSTIGPFTTTAAEKTSVPWAFAVPLIGHDFQLIPSGPVRVWFDEIRWDFVPWPELITEATPWLDLGTRGAKYIRGVVIPIDTGGNNSTLTFTSPSGSSESFPVNTTAMIRTPQPLAFTTPFIAESLQVTVTPGTRIWWDEIRWDFDPWPELTDEATGWMPVLPGGGAAFLQGLILPVETGGVAPALTLLTDTGASISLTATVTPPANIKTGIPYSLATPVVCHQVQLVPTSPCRIWVPEIQWVAEPTPELATTWTTQFTALGGKGYKHIARIEASYAASQAVVLTVTSYDGASPQAIPLPATGSVYQKKLLTLTFNKGQLYRFSAVSGGTFQMFLNDWIVWTGEWGRGEGYRDYRLLGAEFGDKARI